MKEFWALVSFEYRKILGKRSVKIALLLTLFLSVFSIWGTLMGSYYIEGELFESNAEAMKKDRAYARELSGRILDDKLLMETADAYQTIPDSAAVYQSTEEYQNAKAILKGGTKKMNKAIEIGRLTRDPEVRYSQGSNTAVARYTVAVDRKFKREGEPTADFIPCVAFGKQAEFAEKYFRKGTKVVISGRITTGSYTNKDGQKIYVPSREEVQASAVPLPEGEQEDARVDLNKASKEELMTLSGIGESRADAILEYRKKQGGFRSAEELKEVEGIKDGIFDKIKDQIKVS